MSLAITGVRVLRGRSRQAVGYQPLRMALECERGARSEALRRGATLFLLAKPPRGAQGAWSQGSLGRPRKLPKVFRGLCWAAHLPGSSIQKKEEEGGRPVIGMAPKTRIQRGDHAKNLSRNRLHGRNRQPKIISGLRTGFQLLSRPEGWL